MMKIKTLICWTMVALSGCASCDEESEMAGRVPGTPRVQTEREPDLADLDGDGIEDDLDNCVATPNVDQLDVDTDGVGSACDVCPFASDPDQLDADGNGVGDACEPTSPGPDSIENLCYRGDFSPDVTTIAPSIMVLLDASGSMANQLEPDRAHPWPIEQAADAIGTVADQLAGSARIGLAQFPDQAEAGSTCTATQQLSVGANAAQDIKDAVAEVDAIGNTPTGFALNSVLDDDLLADPTAPYGAQHPRGVILITDGDPTVACDTGEPVNLRHEAQPEAVAAAQRLADAGIPVYVIGFRSGAVPENLTEIAQAGGTNDFLTADDPGQLVAAIEDITRRIVSCAYAIDEPPATVVSMSVAVDGAPVPEDVNDGWTHDEATNVVRLNGMPCDEIKNAADPASKVVSVEMVCRYDF